MGKIWKVIFRKDNEVQFTYAYGIDAEAAGKTVKVVYGIDSEIISVDDGGIEA